MPDILVIENDEMIGVKVSAALEGAGYRVIRAEGALEGLDKLYQIYPDLIILDSDLGMVDGEDTYARIQQTTHLPLIVIGVQEEAVEVLELGADAFMVKPPSLTELVARVRRLLQQKSRVGTRGDKSEPKIENDLRGDEMV